MKCTIAFVCMNTSRLKVRGDTAEVDTVNYKILMILIKIPMMTIIMKMLMIVLKRLTLVIKLIYA